MADRILSSGAGDACDLLANQALDEGWQILVEPALEQRPQAILRDLVECALALRRANRHGLGEPAEGRICSPRGLRGEQVARAVAG